MHRGKERSSCGNFDQPSKSLNVFSRISSRFAMQGNTIFSHVMQAHKKNSQDTGTVEAVKIVTEGGSEELGGFADVPLGAVLQHHSLVSFVFLQPARVIGQNAQGADKLNRRCVGSPQRFPGHLSMNCLQFVSCLVEIKEAGGRWSLVDFRLRKIWWLTGPQQIDPALDQSLLALARNADKSRCKCAAKRFACFTR